MVEIIRDKGEFAPVPHSGIALGQVLDGRYLIERQLGKGGVGEVYLGRHQRTGRPCAIKFLSAEGGLDDSSLRRFEREARTLGSLGHPGIVGIHDFAETPEGVPYLVMDFLEGEDLAQRLHRDGAMHWDMAKALFREMAHALHAAHNSGVLHRDLKPGNVFLAQTPGAPDRVVLLDFGLAKANAVGLGELSLTRTGAVLGTPLYMSPEQARGAKLDERSDLYSLATILFEMLAGRPPFLGENLAQLVSRLVLDPVPVLSELAPHEAPAHLDEVLRIALAKAPEDRHPDVLEFASAVLQKPLAESWKLVKAPIPPTLAATLRSDPPRPADTDDAASPGAHESAQGSTQPEARSGTEPRYDGSLAIQMTLESGELPQRPDAASDTTELKQSAQSYSEAMAARDDAAADNRKDRRRSSTSWMLNVGILLLGVAAAAAVFWLVFGRNPGRSPSPKPSAKTASSSNATKAAAPAIPGKRDASVGGPPMSTTPVDAATASPRIPDAAPNRPMQPAAPVRKAHPMGMPARRPAVSGATSARRPPRMREASRPKVPDTVPPARSANSPPAMAPSFGEKIYKAGLLRGKAVKAEQQGKGRPCLSLLDKADRIHPESAHTFHYIRAWCLMRTGRCAAGRRMLTRYYQRLGTTPIASKNIIRWAENAKCLASTGSPKQQLVRVHQQLTTACAIGGLASCGAYVRKLTGLISKLPRPHTTKQKTLFQQGFMRAAIRYAKAGRCGQALRVFKRSAVATYGNSPRADQVARQWLNLYNKSCFAKAGGP